MMSLVQVTIDCSAFRHLLTCVPCQVSPELFSKFDFIHMQSRGQMVYFGPTGQAATYMEHLG